MYQFKYDWYEHIASKQFDYCDKTYVNVASQSHLEFGDQFLQQPKQLRSLKCFHYQIQVEFKRWRNEEINALCSYPLVKIEIKDSIQILSPHFLEVQLFQTEIFGDRQLLRFTFDLYLGTS